MITTMVADILADPRKYLGKRVRCSGRIVYARGAPPRMVDSFMEEARRHDGSGDGLFLREPTRIMRAIERSALGLRVGGSVVLDSPAILRGVLSDVDGSWWLSDVESGTLYSPLDESLFDFDVRSDADSTQGI